CAIRDKIARQAEVEQGHAAAAVAVIHPVLRRELDPNGPLDYAERNLLHVAPLLDGRREKRLVADVFLVVHEFGLDLDAAHAGVEPDARGEAAAREWMRHVELSKHRSTAERAA